MCATSTTSETGATIRRTLDDSVEGAPEV